MTTMQTDGAVDVTFHGLTFTVQPRGGGEPVQILKGLSGAVRSGRCLAIMGASGAGKVGRAWAGSGCALLRSAVARTGRALGGEQVQSGPSARRSARSWLHACLYRSAYPSGTTHCPPPHPPPTLLRPLPPQTTLLDVLAGHTYTGTIGGEVLVNGKPRHLKSFLRIRWVLHSAAAYFRGS